MKLRRAFAFFLIAAMSTSVAYADVTAETGNEYSVPVTMEPCEEQDHLKNSTSSLEEADIEDPTPDVVPTEATPSEAMPPDTSLIETMPAKATPSEATPSEIVLPSPEVLFQTAVPGELPSWYEKTEPSKFKDMSHYCFIDRLGQKQYRTYGFYEDNPVANWYECDYQGTVAAIAQMIHPDWEDMTLAPYRYVNSLVGENEISTLSNLLTKDETALSSINTSVIASLGKNYDGTNYDVWEIVYALETGDSAPSYYFYGSPVNGHELVDQWYQCDETGTVLSDIICQIEPPESSLLSLNQGADVVAEECHISGWNTDEIILAARTIPNGGRLIIDCGLAKKYNNQVAIYNYLGSSNNRHKVIIFYKANPSWTNLSYYSETWAEGYRWVYAPIDENAYWYARSSVNMSAHWNWSISEVNAGGYTYDSESEGKQWATIPMKSNYFKMVVRHNYGNWSTTKPSTCFEAGVQSRTCTGCGISETRSLAALEHSYAADYYTGADDGTYYKPCVRSGCTGKADIKSNPYTIKYTANGGHGEMAPQSHTYNTSQHLSVNSFYKDYHAFQGWSQDPGSSNLTYTDGQSVKNLTTKYKEEVVLYAQWEPNTYEITYDDGFDGAQTVIKKQRYTEQLGALPAFSRAGYILTGFYTLPENGDAITEHTNVPPLNVTYYAQWSPNEYDLTFHVQNSLCGSKKKTVTFDRPVGILPTPTMEDFAFTGWYTEPYTLSYREEIMCNDLIPAEEKKIAKDTTYQVDGNTDIYAYMVLQYREIKNNRNLRPGKDEQFNTNDDNYYLNGFDTIAGTRDDIRIYSGLDGLYETADDYYLDEQKKNIYPGKDEIFGTADDYRDNADGTNTRPGPDMSFDTHDDINAWNGFDQQPGSDDDWVDHSSDYPNTNLRPGPDGIFGTPDDEIFWNGPDDIAGTKDDQLIHPGMDKELKTNDDWIDNESHYPNTNLRPGPDGIFGTPDDEIFWNGPDDIAGTKDDQLIHPGMDKELETNDDWVDNESHYPNTNLRPGPDGIFGTPDDEIFWNGPDDIAGTKDDQLIHPGMDKELETNDDWVDNESHYPNTNLRPGPDGIFGTPDDEVYWNGPDSIPGNADDKLILPGFDDMHGTEDDCFDNSDEQDGTNIRPGSDGIFGTDDDELWLNGSDGLPGTEDDEKYVPHHSSGGSNSKPKKPKKPIIGPPELPIIFPELLFPLLDNEIDNTMHRLPPAYNRINTVKEGSDFKLSEETTLSTVPVREIVSQGNKEVAAKETSQNSIQEPCNWRDRLKKLIDFIFKHPIVSVILFLIMLILIWLIVIILRILTRKQAN